MVFDAINIRACIDSGNALFLVAPPSGGKTTLIKYLEGAYSEKRFIQLLERISPLRMLVIQDSMNDQHCLMMSEDFSTLGDDESAVFKMAIMVSKLSYDKRYIDTLFVDKKHPEGLRLFVKSCAFVCGMQPLWLQIYSNKEVFETMIMEKILRYYRLPIMPIHETTITSKVVASLNETIQYDSEGYKPSRKQVKRFQQDLKIQCGARATEYAYPILSALSHYVPKATFNQWIKQIGARFRFEKDFLMRYYVPTEIMAIAEALYKAYTVLFFTMQYNSCTYTTLRDYVKIRAPTQKATFRYMRYLINRAMEVGFCTVLRKSKLYIMPSTKFKRLSLYNFNKEVLKHGK